MQHIGWYHDFTFLPVASNDNEDLLALPFPAFELTVIQEIKKSMRIENAQSGILLRSRRERLFFQEVVDAERYILLRYFTLCAPEKTLRSLKRYILDHYLSPYRRRRGKKASKPV
jgi:hypothetical protein